jgi:hypothetical protein
VDDTTPSDVAKNNNGIQSTTEDENTHEGDQIEEDMNEPAILKKVPREIYRMNTRGNKHKLNNAVEEFASKISVNEAIRTRGGAAEEVIKKELTQMIKKGVWTPIDSRTLSTPERNRVIRSSMFLKEKYRPTGEFEKLKARLVAGGHMQDKTLYDDLSSPTVGTSSVFTVLTIAAHENRMTAVLDIGVHTSMRTWIQG